MFVLKNDQQHREETAKNYFPSKISIRGDTYLCLPNNLLSYQVILYSSVVYFICKVVVHYGHSLLTKTVFFLLLSLQITGCVKCIWNWNQTILLLSNWWNKHHMLNRLVASGEETPLLFSCMLACPTMPLRNFYMRLESLKNIQRHGLLLFVAHTWRTHERYSLYGLDLCLWIPYTQPTHFCLLWPGNDEIPSLFFFKSVTEHIVILVFHYTPHCVIYMHFLLHSNYPVLS